jgi:hypothetical protein
MVAAAVVAGLALAAFGMWQIELLNRRVQVERRLAADPTVAAWIERMKSEVGQFERPPAGGQPTARAAPLAEAIWYGTVADRPRNRPDRSHPEVVIVRLKPAWLLAGRRSPKDESGGEVSVGVRDFQFATGEPQLGERWLFAVHRRNGGYNFVRDALAVP